VTAAPPITSAVERAMRMAMRKAAAGAITMEQAIAEATCAALTALADTTDAERREAEDQLLLAKYAEQVERGEHRHAVSRAARTVAGRGNPQRAATLERRLRRRLGAA
jgi:hypothetical protein